jgi:glutamine synthetase
LPTSLEEALRVLEESPAAAEWLGTDLHAAYLGFKRAELACLKDLDEEEICRRYAEAY